MADLSAIVSAASGFKTAIDIVKGMQALSTTTEVRQKTSELLDAIVEARFKLLEASEAQSSLLNRISELEQEVKNFDDWNHEKERFELKAIDRGAFAYMHKAGARNGEPSIWLCQTCFEKRLKSPLQFRGQDRGDISAGRGSHARWGCNVCKGEVTVYYRREPTTSWEPDPSSNPSPPATGIGNANLRRS